MRESLEQFKQRRAQQGEEIEASIDLRRYSYHTGAPLRGLDPDEPCPVLFRDIGPQAMERFLTGQLTRLAGPLSPITYMRTADYQEPYIDYGRIGRLIMLQPLELSPWHSGVDSIYVARSTRMTSSESLGFVPGDVDLKQAQQVLMGAENIAELRDILGPKAYDQSLRDSVQRLRRLNESSTATDKAGALLLREALKSRANERREWAMDCMKEHSVTESDLCTAWHHIPDARRAALCEIFSRDNMELFRPEPRS
jgi:hypothetical protein